MPSVYDHLPEQALRALANGPLAQLLARSDESITRAAGGVIGQLCDPAQKHGFAEAGRLARQRTTLYGHATRHALEAAE